jgi:multidrug efflux pump subunit AcrA (membrane-fusion protein)
VSVISPKQAAPAQEIILPGNVQPFSSSPIYSRTNGYLRKWYVDIGARVKQGQLLAVIDAPEVDQQVEQSISNLSTLQRRTYRLRRSQKPATKGYLRSMPFPSRMSTMQWAPTTRTRQSLKRIKPMSDSFRPCSLLKRSTLRSTALSLPVTPILATWSIPGALREVKTDLFHIAQPGILRVYVNVPEEYSQGIKDGMTADISLAEFPDRKFQGKLVRTADAINVTTRTLLIEIDVDNPTGTLLTGSYAEVHLAIPTHRPLS